MSEISAERILKMAGELRYGCSDNTVFAAQTMLRTLADDREQSPAVITKEDASDLAAADALLMCYATWTNMDDFLTRVQAHLGLPITKKQGEEG